MRFVSCAAVSSPLPCHAPPLLFFSRTLCRVYCKPMEAIWKSFKYLALKLEMLGRHKRQRTNSRSECQKTNCDLLYFSYLLFFVSCLRVCVCVSVPYFSFCLLCVYFSSVINQQAEQAENANCAHFPLPFYLSLSLSIFVSLSPVSLY